MTESNKPTVTRRKFLLGLAGLSVATWYMPDAHAYMPFEPFTFAYVTDVHLTNDLPDSFILTHESQLFLQELVKELNAEKVDFVMFGGDQVETPGKNENNWSLFCEVVSGLNCPWAFVLGDRDVSGDYGVDKLKTYGPDWKDHGIKTTTSYWSMNPEFIPNVHMVGLDTSLPNTTAGGMSARQLEWLKTDLTENRKSFTMLFAHHPLLPPPPYDGGPPWDDYVIPDGGSVREILALNPQVKLVFSGHVHVTKVQPEKDVWHVANPSLAVFPCGYRIFRVTPQKVAMETRQIEFPALIKKARKALIDSAMASRYSRSNPDQFVALVEGAPEDRESLIPMIPGRQLEPYNSKKAAKQRAKDKEQSQPSEPEKASGSEPEEKRGLFRRKKNSGSPDKQPETDTSKPANGGPESAGDETPADTSTDTSGAQKPAKPGKGADAKPETGAESNAGSATESKQTKGTESNSGDQPGSTETPSKPAEGAKPYSKRPKKSSPDDENSNPPPPAKPEDIDKILNEHGPGASSEQKPPAGDSGSQSKPTDKTK